jgi:hypothetical protein
MEDSNLVLNLSTSMRFSCVSKTDTAESSNMNAKRLSDKPDPKARTLHRL